MIKSIEISIYETKKDTWILNIQWTDLNGFLEHRRKIEKSINACVLRAKKEIESCCQTT